MSASALTVGGHFGAAASLLESGELVLLDGAGHFPMQSVYKLPIARAVFESSRSTTLLRSPSPHFSAP